MATEEYVFFNNLSIEQQSYLHIAGILGSLDEKIELNRRKIAELEALAKTIYDYWFVQFDFPDANGRPYKSSGGKMVWNEQLKREVPEGWDVQPFASIIDCVKNGEWGNDLKQTESDVQVQCLRGTDFTAAMGRERLSPPIRFIEEHQKRKLLEAYDLVIEASGGSPIQSTGRIMYVNQELINRIKFPICCSNFCKAFSVKKHSLFYWAYLSWDKHYEQGTFFRFEGKTSGIKNLQFDSVCNSIINPIPSQIVSELFNDIATPIYSKIQNLIYNSEVLSLLRNTLLPLLMNGQVEVAG